MVPPRNILYVFLDEAGNFDFSRKGTHFFVLSGLSMIRPFPFLPRLSDLKYNLWEEQVQIEYFHASEDNQRTRDAVLNILGSHIEQFRLDSVIVEKPKTNPTLQHNTGIFYKKVLDILLCYILEVHKKRFDEAIIVTDKIPVEKKRKEIEKAIKLTLADWSRAHGNRYEVLHFASKSDMNLQVVDYLNWAVFKKWERNDVRSYDLIKDCVKSEFEVFKNGKNLYY